MVKSYLRHGPTEVFGLICSSTSNSLYEGNVAFVPGLEDVLVWDVKKGEKVGMWHATGHTAPVTALARSPVDPVLFAAGYQDGSVRLWTTGSGENKEASIKVVLEGHRRAVTSLTWDLDGARLASGAADGEAVIWDVVGEVGLFRLRAHRDTLTALAFVKAPSSNSAPTSVPATHLLTTSKDTYLKLWDLSSQHCIETAVAHRSGSWGISVLPPSVNAEGSEAESADETPADVAVLTTGAEGEAKLWSLSARVLLYGPQREAVSNGNITTETSQPTSTLVRAIVPVHTLALSTSSSANARVSLPSVHTYSLPGGARGTAIAVQVGERVVEVWRVRGDEEVKKVRRRRKKRAEEKKKSTEKGKQKMDSDKADQEAEGAEGEGASTWSDRLAPWIAVRGSGRIRSFAFDEAVATAQQPSSSKLRQGGRAQEVRVLLALSTNALEVFSLPPPSTKTTASEAVEPSLLHALMLPGHRTDVRALAISSDDQLLASAANGSVKIWNIKTQRCIRTMEGGYALVVRWLPGDRHLVVGTKTGQVHLYDLTSSILLETFEAHTGPVWGLSVRPDGRGIVTGSADKDVKFWSFEVKHLAPEETLDAEASDDEPAQQPAADGRKVLTMVHTRTLKMSDDVLGVQYSPDGRLLAVSLLDATVKIFYQDTLKFLLSLYGHKLPVLSMDISSDSKLIVTCSADKNVKIWGLDFGDCHRSLFAHEESVMQVVFEKGSHLFWTVGKDNLVKYWDGDKFECVQKFEGHHGEVWALATSHKGDFVVTSSHDKSIRIWEKTDEPLFLEEERERELELMYASEDVRQHGVMAVRRGEVEGEPAAEDGEAEEVSKQTSETLMAGEKIVEALDIAEEDAATTREYEEARKRVLAGAGGEVTAKNMAPPTRHPMLQASGDVSATEYVYQVVRKIPAAALQDALLVLPFSKVALLLGHLDQWASRGWNISSTCRILFFLLRTHQSQIVATGSMRQTILSLQTHLDAALDRQRSMIGYNLAALKFMKSSVEAKRTEDFYEKEAEAFEKGTLGRGEESEEQVRKRIAEGAKKKRKVVLK